MAWLAIEKGIEVIYDRDENRNDGQYFNFIQLPAGTIEKLTGKKLTANEAPVLFE